MNESSYLEIEGIYKFFPGMVALDNVNLKCNLGEIVGLIGENGAGKSTLMKILAGVYSSDKGIIKVLGNTIAITNPLISQKNGIFMVYQDTKLVPDLRVMQNIWLGHESINSARLIDSASMYTKSKELLDKFEIEINPRAYVRNLSMSQKQLVEIIRAISHDTKILILDEPTSALTPKEVGKLFEMLMEIKRGNTGIIFISHRLSEVLKICDRFVVLRDGKVSGEVSKEDANESILVKYMIGRELKKFFNKKVIKNQGSEVALDVENLTAYPFYKNISFNVKQGEIVGIFGVQGNGQKEILRTLAGLDISYSGKIKISQKEVLIRNPKDSTNMGIAYLTSERREEGVFLPLSIEDNIIVQTLDKIGKFGFIDFKKVKGNSQQAISLFNIKCNNAQQCIEELSGGNQQKTLFASQYLKKPILYLLDDPTAGIDINSKSEIYTFLRDLVANGVAVLVLSNDITECISICDRIIVVSKGKIIKEIDHKNATEENIMEAAVSGINIKVDQIKPKNKSLIINNISNNASLFILISIIFTLCIIGAQKSEYFLSFYNLSNIALQIAPLAFVALGQGLVILLGGIDLSVGPIVSLITAVASYTIINDSMAAGIVLCLAIGVSLGFINGIIITKLKIPDIITTLATYISIAGLALIVRPTGGGAISARFISLTTYKFFDYIPIVTIVLIIFFVLAEFFMQKMRIGTYIYAAGSNKEAAFTAGINVNRLKLAAYCICGLTAAIAGLIIAAKIGSGNPKVGTEFTMSSITAVVVAGIYITGGRGYLSSTFLGALMIILMQNVLNLIQISAYFQYVWVGLLLLLSVTLQQLPKILSGNNNKIAKGVI